MLATRELLRKNILLQCRHRLLSSGAHLREERQRHRVLLPCTAYDLAPSVTDHDDISLPIPGIGILARYAQHQSWS